MPSLVEMGYPELPKPSPYPGGETVALSRMRLYIAKKDWIANFEKVSCNDNMSGESFDSHFSHCIVCGNP